MARPAKSAADPQIRLLPLMIAAAALAAACSAVAPERAPAAEAEQSHSQAAPPQGLGENAQVVTRDAAEPR